ncbi:MAG: glycosyltransferase family 4 protein, partial [Flavobacteriales bacterium]|nr:glycosyltransferase family 4 protein [Flavobacteriales bacterium]
LIITYYWPPSGGAGVQRCLKFVKYLPENNVMPFVVTVDEEKATYPVKDSSLGKEVPSDVKVYRTNTKEPFNIYRKLLGKGDVPFAGFTNESNPSLVQNLSRFIRGNFFIPDARKGWNHFAYQKCVELIEKEGIDTILTSSPPHSTQLIGLKLKKKCGVRWIADIRDPWTDIYYYDKMKHTELAKRLDRQYEKQVLENADRVIVVSDDIKRLFSEKLDKSIGGKITVIPNGFDQNDFKISDSKIGEEFTISYTGTVTEDYNAEVFFKGMQELVKRFPDVNYKIKFVGGINAGYQDQIEQYGISSNLEVVPYVPHSEAINCLLESTALLLVIPDVINNKGILTGKLFEYLGSRKPIVCIGPKDGDAARIINECNAGSIFEQNDLSKLVGYLAELTEQWLKNGEIVLDGEEYLSYTRQHQTKLLAAMINE